MRGHHGHLSAEQKQLAFRLRAQGWRLVEIAREIGCTAPMVGLMVRDGRHRQGEPFGWGPRTGSLMIGEREQILLGIGRRESLSAIETRYLGGHPALFPALARRWAGHLADAEALADVARRIAALDGWGEPGSPADPAATAAEISRFVADLVEPARVEALDKLGEGGRALRIATDWLRAKYVHPEPAAEATG